MLKQNALTIIKYIIINVSIIINDFIFLLHKKNRRKILPMNVIKEIGYMYSRDSYMK